MKGTTTDPVRKAMEPAAPGTGGDYRHPGMDDEGDLGELRVRKARQELNRVDVALLVADAAEGLGDGGEGSAGPVSGERDSLPDRIHKADLLDPRQQEALLRSAEKEGKALLVSAREDWRIRELKEEIGGLAGKQEKEKHLVADLISPSDFAVLVIPIDKAAPQGPADPAPAADHPGYPGRGSQGGDGTERRTGRHPGISEKAAVPGDHRQPGVRNCGFRDAAGNPADFFFYLVCQI